MTYSFAKRVGSKKLLPKQPQQKEFSRKQWENEFLSTVCPSSEDERLYKSGLWFHKHFEEIGNQLNKIAKYNDKFENLIRFQVGAINIIMQTWKKLHIN